MPIEVLEPLSYITGADSANVRLVFRHSNFWESQRAVLYLPHRESERLLRDKQLYQIFHPDLVSHARLSLLVGVAIWLSLLGPFPRLLPKCLDCLQDIGSVTLQLEIILRQACVYGESSKSRLSNGCPGWMAHGAGRKDSRDVTKSSSHM